MSKAPHWTRWTARMNRFLINNFGKYGDAELARIFEKKFPKHFSWTLKHIERRRSYLNLKRSQKQLLFIRARNKAQGNACNLIKTWNTRGRMHEGQIRYWHYRGKLTPYIKHNGRAIRLQVYLAQQNQINTTGKAVLETGEILTRAQLAIRNKRNSLSYPVALQHTIKQLNQLTKILNG